MDWDEFFIKMTRLVAEKSKDQSTKCGCVVVGPDNEVRSTGYNGLPRGMDYTEKAQERPYKYFVFEHSERNAIYNAARMGVSLNGCKAYVTGPPCHDCARGMVQAGIKEVVIPVNHNFRDKEKNDRWKESCDVAMEIFEAGDVEFRYFDDTQEAIAVISDDSGNTVVQKLPVEVTPGPTKSYTPKE